VQRHLGQACLESRWRQVDLQPVGLALRAGERLRLSLAAAAWPQVAVNPGNGELPRGGASHDHRPVTLQLRLDGAELSLRPLGSSPGAGQTVARLLP
jgi:hypothetical protein